MDLLKLATDVGLTVESFTFHCNGKSESRASHVKENVGQFLLMEISTRLCPPAGTSICMGSSFPKCHFGVFTQTGRRQIF